MTNFKITVITCFVIFMVVSIGIAISDPREAVPFIGLAGLILSAIYLFAGLLLLIPVEAREIGKGVLLASGILLLVGFGICGTAMR